MCYHELFCGQDYKPDEDPSIYKSSKTGRGPLVGPEWDKLVTPVMCCYKLVTVEFKWWGLQSRVERFIHKVSQLLQLLICINKQYSIKYGRKSADVMTLCKEK